MIAYLKGKVLQKTAHFLIVENQNIGYKVFVIPELLDRLVGEEIELYTYLRSSDDGQTLFGLPDFANLQFFELLITVTGVGPKMALTILSAAKIPMLQSAIAGQDSAIFTRISGVGKKTAEHIILELKNKVGIAQLDNGGVSGSDVYDALLGLGYSAREVRDILPKINSDLEMEGQIKQALKLLSR